MLAGLLGAPVIGSVIKAFLGPVLQTYLAREQMKTDAAGSHEARVGELAAKALDLDGREAELNHKLLVVEQGNWFTRLPRPAMAMAVTILVWKLLVWDLALGQWTQGRTDKLSEQTFWLVTTIVIAYFGGRSAEKISKIIASTFGKK